MNIHADTTTTATPLPARRRCDARRFALGLLAAASLATLTAPGAFAQATKIFIASTGNDANTGSRTAPKRNLQAAQDALATDGEIVVLDTAGYGTFNITKGLTVTVPPGVNGFITAVAASSSNDAITITTNADAVVTLRGLIITGDGVTGSGIITNTVGTLNVEDCVIRNFNYGIQFTSPSNAHLLVSNSTIRNVYDGVYVRAEVTNVRIDAVMTASKVDAAGQGALFAFATNNGAVAQITANSCILTHNQYAVYAYGGIVTLDACTVSGNANGVTTPLGGKVVSRGNNTFNNNTPDVVSGATFTTLAGK